VYRDPLGSDPGGSSTRGDRPDYTPVPVSKSNQRGHDHSANERPVARRRRLGIVLSCSGS